MKEWDMVGWLLKQPHAMAESVLHTLSDADLMRLAKGFPVSAPIQERIKQELLSRQLAEKKSNEYGHNYWKDKIILAAFALFGGLALFALQKLLE